MQWQSSPSFGALLSIFVSRKERHFASAW